MRGGSYRGSRSSYRGGGGYRGGSNRGRYNSYDNRDKYSSREDYGHPKSSYRDSYSSRDYRSPERKRPRNEGSSSRHDSYSGSFSSSRYESHGPPSYERSRHSGERYSSSPYPSKRDEFRKPAPRGLYRGRLSTRGSRGLMKSRDRLMPRRRMLESSYAVRKRMNTRGLYRGMKPRMRSSIGFRRRNIPRSDEDEDDEEEKVSSDEGKTPTKKAKTEGEAKEKKEGEEEVEGEEKSESKEDKTEDKDESKLLLSETKKFVKLQCPHCHHKALTFGRYEMHLRSRSHIMAMRRLSIKQKSILAQMRQAQRKSQNELEKEGKAETSGKTQFCMTCRLNYQTEKSVHQASESHKNMRKFLYPFCKCCGLQYKSPMGYENHLATIEHMKHKQKKVAPANEDASDDDNLEDFTTIDSVGEGGDEAAGSGNEGDEKKEGKEKKEPVLVGAEKVIKLEVHYCELCRMYLPRVTTEEELKKVLAKHCKQSVHIRRYIKMKENQEMEKRAEKLQRKELAEKEKKKEAAAKKEGEEGEEPMETDAKEEKEGDVVKEDDKLWEAVDKDLGELLGEADGAKSDEDDDDESGVNGERYDRFKLSSDQKKDDNKPEVEKMEVVEEKKEKAKAKEEK